MPVMFKKLFAIIVFSAVLMQTFSTVMIMAAFYANRDYIAANLCENRDKPKMQCNGKCSLNKQLAKEAEHQAPVPQNVHKEELLLYYEGSTFAISYGQQPAEEGMQFPAYNELNTIDLPGTIFHPPDYTA